MVQAFIDDSKPECGLLHFALDGYVATADTYEVS